MNEEKLQTLRTKASLGKPVFLLGPRGTGKTTLLEKLTSELGREYVYINLEYDGEMREFMESCAQKHGSSDLFLSVAERLGIAPEASGKVLFIFDDLEYSPMIVSSLLGTDLRENLILASDLATNEIMTLAERCERVSLSTLDFGGFLEETGHQWYREVIEAHFQKKKKIPEMIHSDILDCYEDFLQTGGMPQSVAAYKASGADGVRHAQRMIKNDLCQGLKSLKDESLRGRTEAVMSSLADQALNTRFNFCEIRKGTSFGFYREAIKLLERSGIAIRIDSKGKGFELFPSDCGMLCAELDRRGAQREAIRHILNKCAVFMALRGKGYEVKSWESAYKARLECIYVKQGKEIPVDIADEKNHTKSLESYIKSKGESGEDGIKAVRLWYKNFEERENVFSIPIYAAFCL